jgi:Holliday junction resolvase RusA-like endonuclease
MIPQKITTIPVWPATNVRSTQGDRWLFSVSDEYLKAYDQKRMETHGRVGRNLDRKRQLEKYNAYKEEIRYWVDKTQFVIPLGHFAMWFYLPFPKSWRKPKRLEMAGKAHMSTPDLDNMIKAIFDSIMPRRSRISGEKGADDRKIHLYLAGKIWVPEGQERIDIVEYTESDFMSAFSYLNPTYPTYFNPSE